MKSTASGPARPGPGVAPPHAYIIWVEMSPIPKSSNVIVNSRATYKLELERLAYDLAQRHIVGTTHASFHYARKRKVAGLREQAGPDGGEDPEKCLSL